MVSSNNAINNTVGASISGVTNTLTVTNPSNTASSVARATVVVGGGTSGDPSLNWNVTGVTNWEMGIDNSDSDKWKLSQGTTLGTNDTITADVSGRVLKPLQPSFLAYLNVAVTNVTGDGTPYTIAFDTENFDVGNNFTTGAGSHFTAPVSGIYAFNLNVNFSGLTVAHNSGTVRLYVNGGATIYTGGGGNPHAQSGLGLMAWNQSIILQLTANDTISPVVVISNGTKVVGIVGTGLGTIPTYFSGYLLG
jgi:hypothetical protein